MLLLIIVVILFLGYGWLMYYYYRSWNAQPVWAGGITVPATKLSVIIPARNEEEHIGALLDAIHRQSYPAHLTEVIVVDDHSTDATATIAGSSPGVRVISLGDDIANSFKKKAIETGIRAASGELILTTDADCIPGKKWLETIVGLYQEKDAVMIAGPVRFSGGDNVRERFQVIDFMTLQGITAASLHSGFHSMCNGANLAYKKAAFLEVGGFTGIDHIASGDDMLLMHKIRKRYPEGIYYLKSPDAIVTTTPAPDWRAFFRQRIRWASKAAQYEDKRVIWVLLLVYLLNLSFLAMLVAGFWSPVYWLYWVLFLLAKTAIEFPFVLSVSSFFQRPSLMRHFIFLQPLHIVYTLIAGWLGQTGTYEWKGRRVK